MYDIYDSFPPCKWETPKECVVLNRESGFKAQFFGPLFCIVSGPPILGFHPAFRRHCGPWLWRPAILALHPPPLAVLASLPWRSDLRDVMSLTKCKDSRWICTPCVCGSIWCRCTLYNTNEYTLSLSIYIYLRLILHIWDIIHLDMMMYESNIM